MRSIFAILQNLGQHALPKAEMTLYEFGPNPSVRARGMLLEPGVAFAPVPVNPPADEHRRSALLSANPATRVAAVVDGGRVLTESVAIVLYLPEKYPEARLLPADAGSARGAPAGLRLHLQVRLTLAMSTVRGLRSIIRRPVCAGEPPRQVRFLSGASGPEDALASAGPAAIRLTLPRSRTPRRRCSRPIRACPRRLP